MPVSRISTVPDCRSAVAEFGESAQSVKVAAFAVNRLAGNVEHSAQRLFADRHADWRAGVDNFVCRAPGRRSNQEQLPVRCFAEVLGYLQSQFAAVQAQLPGVINSRQFVA